MDLQVDKELVIPKQGLEGKLAFVAKIVGVSPYGGAEFEDAQDMAVQITNKSGKLNGGISTQICNQEEFKRLLGAYRLSSPDDLLGKPIISVYRLGNMLTGLIPLDMDG